MKYRRNMTLDPMNAYERHVIHTALQNYENITTYSVGSEPNRRIVVAYGRNSDSSGRAGAPQYREWS
jgi:spoIIIJ-associated protein